MEGEREERVVVVCVPVMGIKGLYSVVNTAIV